MGGAPQQFRLQAVQVPMPKWGKACGWTARDDAMLLLGVFWCAGAGPRVRACLRVGRVGVG
jgi:hypothetical protein